VVDGQSISKFWCPAPSGGHEHIYYYLAVTVLFLWGAISGERTGLSFVYAAGRRQRGLSRARVSWDSYFTVSDLRLPFSSPPTTGGITAVVFESTPPWLGSSLYTFGADSTENTLSIVIGQQYFDCCLFILY
jgi:hypothetical protein